MIRRLNYTGRRKIPRSCITIRLFEHGQRRSFDAELDLQALELPSEASVFVEAYYRAAYQRFAFGTVGELRPPAERWLDKIPQRKPLFRVKVVHAHNGLARILASADQIRPLDADGAEDHRDSLLPVEYADLGDRIWKLELDDDGPCLLLNKRFEGIREAARSGPEFLSLVYPEVFRAILQWALDDQGSDPDDNDDGWRTLWMRFACRELGCPRPPETRDDTEIADWIDSAVNALCVRMRAAQHFEQLLDRRNA